MYNLNSYWIAIALNCKLYVILTVHLRIREIDQLCAKSLYPSSSANTYWQVEAESSVLCGKCE